MAVCESCKGAKYVLRDGEPAGCPACWEPERWKPERIGLTPIEVVRFDRWRDVPGMRRPRQMCDELLERRRWCVFLRGGNGRGKTTLLVMTLAAWLDRRLGSAYYADTADLIDQLRSYHDRGDIGRVHERVEFLVSRDFLGLDDIHLDRWTEFAEETVVRVVRGRERRKAATFVTTNVAPGEEKRRDARGNEWWAINPQVQSRLAGGEFAIKGVADQRKEASV